MAFEETKFSTNVMNQASQTLTIRSLAGSRAKVIEEGNKIYVEIDGRKVEADKRDLFGINKSNMNEYLERLVAAYDEQMAKTEENISFWEKMEKSIKAAMKTVKNTINGILAQCHVTSIGQIQDESQKTQALGLRKEWWKLDFEGVYANNQTHLAFTDKFLAACHKGDAQMQIAFNESVLQRLNVSG